MQNLLAFILISCLSFEATLVPSFIFFLSFFLLLLLLPERFFLTSNILWFIDLEECYMCIYLVQSLQFDSARLSLTQVDSAWLSSIQLDSVRFSSTRWTQLNLVWISSNYLNSAWLSLTQFDSARLSHLDSAWVSSTQLNSARLSLTQLNSAWLSWTQLVGHYTLLIIPYFLGTLNGFMWGPPVYMMIFEILNW